MHSTLADQIQTQPLARRRRLSGPLAAAIAALTLAAVPSLASAQSLNTVSINTTSTSANLVLDVNGASTTPGAPVIQWFRNGNSNQRWNFVQLPDGNEQIVNQNSGMCLTTDGVAGHWVYQWPCDSSNPHQEWRGTLSLGSTNITHRLANVYSGLFLDVDGNSPWPGAHLITWYYDGSYGDFFSYTQLS
jgi:hypothetical protein